MYLPVSIQLLMDETQVLKHCDVLILRKYYRPREEVLVRSNHCIVTATSGGGRKTAAVSFQS